MIVQGFALESQVSVGSRWNLWMERTPHTKGKPDPKSRRRDKKTERLPASAIFHTNVYRTAFDPAADTRQSEGGRKREKTAVPP